MASVAVVVLVACLGLSTGSALGLAARGHVFSFSFSTAGLPSGVAVDESTGRVYVARRGGAGEAGCAMGCVQEFEPSPGATPVATIEVPDPGSIAVDNSAASPSHRDIYVSGATKKAVKEAEPEDKIVYKFSAAGALLAKLKRFKTEKGETEEFAPVSGLAVDGSGKLFVYDEEGEVARFNNAEKNKSLLSLEPEFVAHATPGLAVDPGGVLYLGHESENPVAEGPAGEPPVIGTCQAPEPERECETLSPELDQQPTTAVAVNSSGEAFITNVETLPGKKVTSVAAFTSDGSLIQRFSGGGLSEGDAIAADSASGALYVADAASKEIDAFALEPPGAPRVDSLSACLTSQCSPKAAGLRLTAQVDPAGADTHAYFEFGTASCASGTCTKTPERDLGGGFGDTMLTAEVAAGLAPGTTYYFRVAAGNEHGSTTSSEGSITIPLSLAPLADGRAWEMVSPVNKDGLEPEPIVGFGAAIQAAAGGDAITYVSDGPIPAEGQPEGSRNPEPAQILSARGSAHWESQDLFTAVGQGEGIRAGDPGEYQLFSSSLSISLLQPFPGSPETGAWEEPPLAPPSSEGEHALQKEGKPYLEKTAYLHADAPLAPESGNAAQEADYAAARQDGEAIKNAGYLPLVDDANALGVLGGPFGAGFSAGIELLMATPDATHVLLASHRAAPGLYEWGPGQALAPVSLLPKNAKGEELPAPGKVVFGDLPNMRHAVSDDGSRVFWTQSLGETSQLFVRDTTTHETLQVDAVTSGSGAGRPGAVFQTASADGSKVFFTDTQRLTANSKALRGRANKPDLYVFELGPAGAPLSGTLTDLTPEGVNGESAAVQGLKTAGGVLGASEDGTYVYFVANGALSAGAPPGNCDIETEEAFPASTCDLYLTHFNGSEWEAPHLVAVLSNDDAPDWGGAGFPGDLGWLTSRVSPNGRYLAFMSDRSLTGYNNEDVTSKAPGERRDEEVFLYDAKLDRLVCASCNPTGAQPHGVLDPGKEPEPGRETSEGVGLLTDRIGIWGRSDIKAAHWLAGNVPGWTSVSIERAVYQSRYLLDSGRLFFNSPDLLVPAVREPYEAALTAGKHPVSKEKVYEYEPNGVGGCTSEAGCVGVLSSPNGESEPGGERESAFLDASESGDDAFFLTAAKLPEVNGITQDVDGNFDVYDARVCDQAPSFACLPAPALGSSSCEGEACKSAAPHAPEFLSPASMTARASGNVAGGGVLPSTESGKPSKPKRLTRAQLLSRALKQCRAKYKKNRHKRASCEAHARKRYGHASRHKKSKKASHASRYHRRGA